MDFLDKVDSKELDGMIKEVEGMDFLDETPFFEYLNRFDEQYTFQSNSCDKTLIYEENINGLLTPPSHLAKGDLLNNVYTPNTSYAMAA